MQRGTSPIRENKAILSMMKNYTYRFLKSPSEDCDGRSIYQDRRGKDFQKKKLTNVRSNTLDSNLFKADINKRIAFKRPQYK